MSAGTKLRRIPTVPTQMESEPDERFRRVIVDLLRFCTDLPGAEENLAGSVPISKLLIMRVRTTPLRGLAVVAEFAAVTDGGIL